MRIEMKKEFPTAMVKKTYMIQGLNGNYKPSGYREAKDNPNSERAMKGSKVCWFIPDNEPIYGGKDMEIKLIKRAESVLEKYDYREALEIEVNGKPVMSFHDGEAEDNTISRNFSDILGISDLVQKVYDAGKKGEVLTIIEVESEDI